MNVFGSNFQGNNNINMSRGKVTINGKTINVPNGNISMINGELFVDGEKMDVNNTDLISSKDKTINIKIEGNVKNIKCNGSVEVQGDVSSDIDCGGSVSIKGNIQGDIDCCGSVTVKGTHKGSIDAGGSVICNS